MKGGTNRDSEHCNFNGLHIVNFAIYTHTHNMLEYVSLPHTEAATNVNLKSDAHVPSALAIGAASRARHS